MTYRTQLFRPGILTIAFFILTSIGWSNCIAQEGNENEESFHPHHQLGLVISHAHVFDGRDDAGKKKVLSLPSWGIDYTYNFHPRWGVGLHTDIIVEKYKVEEHGGEIIERSYPVAPALMGVYKPGGHWSFLLGMGAEFAKEENLALTRAGIEYSGELPGHWEVFGSLAYDIKWSEYDSWLLGIGIAKLLGKRKHRHK